MKYQKSQFLKILFSLIFFMISLIFLELSLKHVLNNPAILSKLPHKVIKFFGALYSNHKMKIIQYDEKCAVYDNQLGYKLKPGSCEFTGNEFSNTYQINSMGLRDDEESLTAPDIIVLGDSYAMGWGVESNETFSALIEHELKVRVLNAAISSYGTVREMELLRKLDISRVNFLILQYCNNDIKENKSFYESNNKYKPMDIKKYLHAQSTHLSNTNYFFGKYVFVTLKSLSTEKNNEMPQNTKLETIYFLNVLEHYVNKLKLSNLKIIVVGTCGDDHFINSLNELLKMRNHNIASNEIVAIRFDWKSTYSYPLDGHYNKLGHRSLAEQLLPNIKN